MYDVRQAAAAAEQGRALHPMVLGAVAQTLTAAARLQAQLQRQGGAGLPALADLAAGIGDALAQLREAIEGCIQVGCRWLGTFAAPLAVLRLGSGGAVAGPQRQPTCLAPCPAPQPEEGRILDSASPALGEVRAARRANRAELRAGMDRWARQLQQQGVSERAQVVVRRERLCIPVRRGRQGELPKGSVTLAASESGNTLYVEPQVKGGVGAGFLGVVWSTCLPARSACHCVDTAGKAAAPLLPHNRPPLPPRPLLQLPCSPWCS